MSRDAVGTPRMVPCRGRDGRSAHTHPRERHARTSGGGEGCGTMGMELPWHQEGTPVVKPCGDQGGRLAGDAEGSGQEDPGTGDTVTQDTHGRSGARPGPAERISATQNGSFPLTSHGASPPHVGHAASEAPPPHQSQPASPWFARTPLAERRRGAGRCPSNPRGAAAAADKWRRVGAPPLTAARFLFTPPPQTPGSSAQPAPLWRLN